MTSEYKIPSNQKFGYFLILVFVICFFYFHLSSSNILSMIFGFLSIIFVFIVILKPSLLESLNRIWFSLGLFLGKLVSPIVLTILFFVLITPVAILMRLRGRDVLLIKKRNVSTYWVTKESIDPESFKNQF